jgi:hypothetical protein
MAEAVIASEARSQIAEHGYILIPEYRPSAGIIVNGGAKTGHCGGVKVGH